MKDIKLKSVYIDQANYKELLESTLWKSCSMDVAALILVKLQASACGYTKRGSHHGFQGKTAQFLLRFEKKNKKMFGRVTGSLKMMA